MFCAKKSLFQITASVTIFIITTSRQVTLRNILSKSYHSVRKHRSSTIKMHKGVTYDHNHHPIDCLFCRIQIGKEPGTILYQDEDFVAFKTISPATDAAHLLITPRDHIKNISSLSGPKDAMLVEKLVDIGKIALGERYSHDAMFCFHAPPFNSINHLHLHAIAEPKTMSYFNYFKYQIGTSWCKSANEVIQNLYQMPDLDRPPLYIYPKQDNKNTQ